MRKHTAHAFATGMCALVLVLTVLSTLKAQRSRAGYDLIELGSLIGPGGSAFPTAVNNRGEVVGTSTAAGYAEHAFLWSEQEGMIDIGAFVPHGISERGVVVGINEFRAVMWSRKTGLVELGDGGAYAVNNAGAIVGFCHSSRSASDWIACLRTRTGVVNLGTPGGPWSYAAAINERGHIAGTGVDANSRVRALLWTPGTGMRVLPYTAGASFAYGINASGDVAGAIKSPPDELWEHAVIWHKRRLVALGSLGASSGYGIARAINNRGQAVGFSETPSGTSHAFVWTSDDGMTDLAPTMIYSEATAINDRGDIVGWFSNGQPTGAIWRAR